MANDGTREITVDVRATPEQVWQAITDPAKTREYYFGTEILSDWTKGAPWTSELDGHVYLGGEILEIEPPHRLVQTFHVVDEEPANGDAPSRVTWELTPMADGTQVHISHVGQGEATLDYTEGGWEHILLGLKKVSEG